MQLPCPTPFSTQTELLLVSLFPSKSPTGVDWFILDTDAGAATKIHRSVDYWAKHIVDQVKNIPAVPGPRHMSASLPPGVRLLCDCITVKL